MIMDELEQIKEKFHTIAQQLGYELVELNGIRLGGRLVIRAYIHKSGGVNIDDCQALSRACSDYLDSENVIHGRYTLEVSSLGLDRPLLKPDDFKRRLGEVISLVLQSGNRPQEVVEGKLILADEKGITLSNQDQKQYFSYDEIKRGKIIY